MNLSSLVPILVFAFCLLAASLVVTFWVFDMMDKAEGLKKRIPWLASFLEKKEAVPVLLFVLVLMLVLNGYELLVKEMPVSPRQPETQPQIESIKVLSQEQLPSSPYPDASYGLKVVLQPATVLQPVKFGLECDHQVLYGEVTPGASFSGMVTLEQGRMLNSDKKTENKNTFVFAVTSPAFKPEEPWIVRLYGKEPLRVIGGQLFH